MNSYYSRTHLFIRLSAIAIASFWVQLNPGFTLGAYGEQIFAQSVPTLDILPEAEGKIYRSIQSPTVRIIKADSAGSGVIVAHHGRIYSVLTNWHVADSKDLQVLTVDDRQHQLVEAPRQIEDADLAVLKFYSEVEYPTAQIRSTMPKIGDRVYAAGFPLIIDEVNSLDWGHEAFRLTAGEVSVIPDKSMPQGYRLGYTNETETGMSGSPIFNEEGAVIAIHGRGKHRDPSFGVYIFEDGTEPNPKQLAKMIESSWGIPLCAYTELFD